MAAIFDIITSSDTDISSATEAYIENTAQRINLNTSLEALFKEIDLTADILYLSYNTLRRSSYSIKVFDCQILFYESVNELSAFIKMLSEGFSHILSITGESYNKFEDFKRDLAHIRKSWHVIQADQLITTIESDLDTINAENEDQIQMVFELLLHTFKNLSVRLNNFYDTLDSLMAGYSSIQSTDTNLKDKSNKDSYALALKFYIYTRCIDTILKKSLVTSNISSQKIGELISKKHLTVSQANEQLIQLTADLKHKWSDKFH